MNNPAFTSRGALFAQAARGPIILIVLGSLFALQQAGALSFSRSWPLLIIAIGVMKLAERLLLGPAPAPPPAAVPPYGTAQPPYNPSAPAAGIRRPQ